MRVDLVYDLDCPNVAAARTALAEAFVVAGLAPLWNEHCRTDGALPAHVEGYGSPTILVDGRRYHWRAGGHGALLPPLPRWRQGAATRCDRCRLTPKLAVGRRMSARAPLRLAAFSAYEAGLPRSCAATTTSRG